MLGAGYASVDVSTCFRQAGVVTEDALVRLGQYVMARRAKLGYKHRIDLANALPLTDRTLADIENGVRPSGAGTYAILENALHWRPGSVAAILEGHEPEAADFPATVDDPNQLSTDELFAELYAVVEELRQRIPSDGVVVRNNPKNRPVPFGWPRRPSENPRMRRNQ